MIRARRPKPRSARLAEAKKPIDSPQRFSSDHRLHRGFRTAKLAWDVVDVL